MTDVVRRMEIVRLGEGVDRTGRFAADSPLPINTHGGHLSEAYIHGMNGIAEAVRDGIDGRHLPPGDPDAAAAIVRGP